MPARIRVLRLSMIMGILPMRPTLANDSAHRLDAGVLEDFAHPVRELVVEFREFRRILISVLELVVLDVLPPGRRTRQPAATVLPDLDVFLRNSRRRNHAPH